MEKAAVYPLIGIPSRRDLSSRSGSPVFAQNRTYVEAVTAAGGAPVLIPPNLDEGPCEPSMSSSIACFWPAAKMCIRDTTAKRSTKSAVR